MAKNKRWELVVFDVSGTLQESDPTSPLYPHVWDALVQLKERGVKVALATNLSIRGLEMFFECHPDVRGLVDSYSCAGLASPKPSSDMMELILLEHDVGKKDVLMVGDTEADVWFAKNAGVACCFVDWVGRTNHCGEISEFRAFNKEELFKALNLS